MMKKEQINVPKLRFSKFTDSWKQQKFSEFTWSASKRNKDNLDLEPYAVTNDRGFIPQSEAHDDFGYMQNVDRTAYNIVPPKSFAYNPARINVGSIGYYEGAENVIVSSLYEVFQTADYIDDRFLWHWIKSDIFPRWVEKLQEGSVRLYFYYDKLCECHIQLPPIDEQHQISAFLDKFDTLITLQQRKLDQIKEYKKGMLQKMFPKEGESVPEVRFPGFTGEWERRKLSNLTSLITKGTTPLDKSGVGKINFIKVENLDPSSGEIISCSKITKEEHEGYLKRSQLKENDILFSIAGTLGRVGIVNLGVLPANTNQALSIIRLKDGYLKYIATVLRGNAVERFIRRNPTIGAQPNLSLEQVGNLEIPYPQLDEQKVIGDFFDNLDTLITLHQRKLEAMKEYKKGLLQQMFV